MMQISPHSVRTAVSSSQMSPPRPGAGINRVRSVQVLSPVRIRSIQILPEVKNDRRYGYDHKIVSSSSSSYTRTVRALPGTANYSQVQQLSPVLTVTPHLKRFFGEEIPNSYLVNVIPPRAPEDVAGSTLTTIFVRQRISTGLFVSRRTGRTGPKGFRDARRIRAMKEKVPRPLPVLGNVTPFTLRIEAVRATLDAADREVLVRWRRATMSPAHKALYEAAVGGIAERLQGLYAARWAKAHRCPVAIWMRQSTKQQKHFYEAAKWLLETGFEPERMLDVCEEIVLSSRRVKYPLPRQLYSGFVLDMIPEWIPPSQRATLDGQSADDVLRETQQVMRERRSDIDPWAENEMGMMGIDFRQMDQRWRLVHKK
jgi:hypothetical protein